MLYEREDMSRSRKKNPIHGITTSDSEKEDKRVANRKERRINKQLLDSTNDDTKLVQRREVSDVWLMDKDGKTRFEPAKHPGLLRK